ncbi:MlaC/ttg2D family ABC transporter substrate-binding protein [Pseudomonas sp. N040]|uniref:MlaC/ttg2D family ABC transporter substrate-binding protein n=1 Tax=Pseudomonas sp. N040 TaxID=2785325 RepID=UPI0018A31B50|nr:ABC transporter substrate-binding protein [Pseudomonas sp. N040]MBF7730312.1 ABC transporter substrate-binding protein [Pseudomonas sp. N040]MBW7013954.1 ABC transporter substrate-binding protein [Pseudomonas sp. N040]
MSLQRSLDFFAAIRRACLLLAFALVCVPAQASQTAVEVVQQTTDGLLADLKANKQLYKQNPSAFYGALDRILGPVVDLEGLSKGVMTVRYSRAATPEQMKRFEESFKISLMRFYGNALLEYDNQEIRVLPAGGKQEPGREAVNMEIKDGKGTVYPLSYTMVELDGSWRMRNVIINGINIGKLFRDQFAQSMKDHGNDLDKVIDTWAETVSKAKQATKEPA